MNKLIETIVAILPKKDRPNPDPFDIEKFPYGVMAGDNKLGLHSCPFCTKPPTHPTKEEYQAKIGWEFNPPNEGFYMFRDALSSKEYTISGLCQDCQDDIFKPHPEDSK